MSRERLFKVTVAAIILVGPLHVVHADQVNLAPNFGFENDPCVDYFTYPDTCSTGGFLWDTQMHHGGSHSIKIISTKPADSLTRWLSKNEKISVVAGRTYRVSLWVKYENIKQHAELDANFWGPGAQTFINKNGASSSLVTGSGDWTLLSVDVVAPQNAKYLRYEVRLYGSGTLWADDAFVEDLSRNLAPNASFELNESENYLTLASDFTKNIFSRAFDASHSGASSLKIVSSQPFGEYSGWLSKNDAIPVTPGRVYNVSGWIKTANATGRAEIAANFWGPGAGDQIVVNGKTSDPISGTQDWKQVSFQVTAPSNANYLKIENRIFGSGTVWFDDLAVHDSAYELKVQPGISPQPLPAPVIAPPPASVAGVTITRWLVLGARGEDVRMLQKYLNQHGYVVSLSGAGSQGQETDFFGPATRTALRKFQCDKLAVCAGSEGATGWGATGPRTRATLSR